MGVLTKDPNVLMKQWMEVYTNLMIMRSTDPEVSDSIDLMKHPLAQANEKVMAFFTAVGADPEAAG